VIVKQSVDKHGGVIDYESRVGKGTVFTIRLPVAHVNCPEVVHPTTT